MSIRRDASIALDYIRNKILGQTGIRADGVRGRNEAARLPIRSFFLVDIREHPKILASYFAAALKLVLK